MFQLNETPMKSYHLGIKADQSLGNYSADEPEVKYRLLTIEGVNLAQFNYNYLMKIV